MVKELINICIGQAGVKSGSACWELYCLEHGIQPDGQMSSVSSDDSFNSFFSETTKGKHVPRAVFVDLEPTVVDKVRTEKYRQLYKPEQLISGKNDTANIYAAGYYTNGAEMIDFTMDRIRKLVDDCGDLGGFIINHAVGGGTGSGFGALLMNRLKLDYDNKTTMSFSIYDTSVKSPVVAPYNSVLATHQLLQNADVSIVLDNQRLLDICSKFKFSDTSSFTDMNRLIAQVSSSVIVPLRFGNSLLSDFTTKLVTYPRLHFMTASFSPLISTDSIYNDPLSVAQITAKVFESTAITANCDTRNGRYMARYMAAHLMYRGVNVLPKDVNAAITTYKTIYDVGITNEININPMLPSSLLAKSDPAVCMISNNTAIVTQFDWINSRFDVMYEKRAFVHHYLNNGMEEGEFSEAREDLTALCRDYEEMFNQSVTPE